MGRLDGKAAIVSGGARGLGEIITRALAREGAAVAFGGRRLDEVSQGLEAELKEQGSQALNVRLDVAQAHDWEAAVEASEKAFWTGGRAGEQRGRGWEVRHRRHARRAVGHYHEHQGEGAPSWASSVACPP